MPEARIFVEDWAAAYGTPYMIAEDTEADEGADVVEDGGCFTFHDLELGSPGDLSLAFVDGVRRGDVSLYQEDPETRALARGVAGSHACGAVLCNTAARPVIDDVRVARLVLWGSGASGPLPAVRGGWSWATESIDSVEPQAPILALQTRMRQNEARLSEDLAADGWHVVVDGPLNFLRGHKLPVCGFVKTHSKSYLVPEVHREVRDLSAGQRTSLFVLHGKDPALQVYSCYLRLRDARADGGPWYGIVRLEFPVSAGIDATIAEADQMGGVLPAYSSLDHCDPRAPQNLQPVGALERELRHRLGDPGLAVRAVRSAVASLRAVAE